MNSTRDELLRSVLENPDDDQPRLVMADWLEENGEPERAEFIRVQCELARTAKDETTRIRTNDREAALMVLRAQREGFGTIEVLHDPFPHRDICTVIRVVPNKRFEALRRRERELLQSNVEWGITFAAIFHPDKPVPGGWYGYGGCAGHGGPAVTWDWKRGFVGSIQIDCDDFMRHADAIFKAEPVVEVRLSDKHPLPSPNEEIDYRFQWMPVYHESYPHQVHWELAGLLDKDEVMKVTWASGLLMYAYRTAEEANAALSDACVAYGRKLAGLPPIKSRK